jgi:hypothetical protein
MCQVLLLQSIQVFFPLSIEIVHEQKRQRSSVEGLLSGQLLCIRFFLPFPNINNTSIWYLQGMRFRSVLLLTTWWVFSSGARFSMRGRSPCLIPNMIFIVFNHASPDLQVSTLSSPEGRLLD